MTRSLPRRFLGRTLAFALLLMLLPLAVANAAGPPRVSQMATVTQTIGLAEVSLTYSRPSVRERKIFGGLVPLGEIWRTGANEATTFTVSQDCTIGGKPLAAGTYSLFTIPGADSWTVIINKQAEQWGAFRYSEDQDAARFEVAPQRVAHTEQMRFEFSDVTADSATLSLLWDTTAVPFEIRFDTPAIAREQARREVAAADADNTRAASQWAAYFYQQESNTAEALAWAKKAATGSPNYWNAALLARLLARNGDSMQAIQAAKHAVQLGTEALAARPNDRMKGDLKELTEQLKSWSGR